MFVGCMMFALIGLIFIFQWRSISTLTKRNTFPPTPTPTFILAQSPNSAPIALLPTNTWKTYQNYSYHFSVMLPPEIVPVTWGDARFDPYRSNGFLFSEEGDYHAWKDRFVFTMEYHPSPLKMSPYTCVDLNTCYTLESAYYGNNPHFPIFATILHKKVKGLGWYGGSFDLHYYYNYSVPVNINGDWIAIQFKFINRTPQQILATQPLINTILSTVIVGN